MNTAAVQRHRVASGLQPDVSVWEIDLDALAQESVDTAVFSPFERERLNRLRFERDRRRYLAAHWGMRLALAIELDRSPQDIHLGCSAEGKPFLEPSTHRRPVEFSLSHSEGAAVLAVSRTGPVGIDIERRRPMPDVDALARAHLTMNEYQRWSNAPSAERAASFLAFWTRKEAALKAIGSGLVIEPSQVETGDASQAHEWRAPVSPGLTVGTARTLMSAEVIVSVSSVVS